MSEPSLTQTVLLLLFAFHAAPLLMLATTAIFASMYIAISDGASTIMILLTAGLLLTFAIQSGLLLAPGF